MYQHPNLESSPPASPVPHKITAGGIKIRIKLTTPITSGITMDLASVINHNADR